VEDSARGLESRTLHEVWELLSENFADPQQFSARLEEIVATGQESADLLELTDGRVSTSPLKR
jgi:hypothetical protein